MSKRTDLPTLTAEMTGAGKLAEAKLQALLSAYSDAALAVTRFARLAEQVRLQTSTLVGNPSLTNGGTNGQPTGESEPTTPESGQDNEKG